MAMFELLNDQLLVGSKISMTPIQRKILTGKNIKSTQWVLLGPSLSWNFIKWDWVQFSVHIFRGPCIGASRYLKYSAKRVYFHFFCWSYSVLSVWDLRARPFYYMFWIASHLSLCIMHELFSFGLQAASKDTYQSFPRLWNCCYRLNLTQGRR